MIWNHHVTFGSDIWSLGVLILMIVFRDKKLDFLKVDYYKKLKKSEDPESKL